MTHSRLGVGRLSSSILIRSWWYLIEQQNHEILSVTLSPFHCLSYLDQACSILLQIDVIFCRLHFSREFSIFFLHFCRWMTCDGHCVIFYELYFHIFGGSWSEQWLHHVPLYGNSDFAFISRMRTMSWWDRQMLVSWCGSPVRLFNHMWQISWHNLLINMA